MDKRIEELKNDPNFLLELNRREEEAKRDRDIIRLYDVLDTLIALEKSDKSRINSIYNLILEIALNSLHSKLESESLFDLDNEYDHYTLRAIYEYGIDHYSHSRFDEAKEIFILLSIVNENPVFKGAMQIHLVAILKKIPFNEFLEKFVDMEAMESKNESFFILYFFDSANQFLHQNSQLIIDAIREVKNYR